MDNIVVRTIIPILLLIGAGLFSRKMGFLKSGDERVLSAYVYYFALPSLFFVDMAEMNFTEETLRFVFAGIIPIFAVLAIYIILYSIFRFSKNVFYLLILSTIFGSTAFFGIPFIMFAFPTRQGELLATLSSASISILSVPFSITVLELYKLGKSAIREGLKRVAKRFSKNPLIISISFDILSSLLRIEIPPPISTSLHMLGAQPLQ